MTDYATAALLAQAAAARWAAQRDVHSPQARLAAYDAWTRALDAGPRHAAVEDLGAVLANLADAPFRDAVVLSVLNDVEPTAPLTTLTGAAPIELTDPLWDQLVSSRTGQRPGEVTFRAGDILDVMAGVDGPLAVPPLAIQALLAWWRFDIGAADELIDRALALDPFHRLAVPVSRLIREGARPGWVTRATA